MTAALRCWAGAGHGRTGEKWDASILAPQPPPSIFSMVANIRKINNAVKQQVQGNKTFNWEKNNLFQLMSA